MASANMFPCAPCECRGISISSAKYCTTCHEHLCKHCSESHKAFKATRKHLLVPCSDRQPGKIEHDLESFQVCSEHPNKQTEFYCSDHDAFLCSICLLRSKTHKDCSKIVDIDTVGKSFLESKFTDNVKDTYRNIIESAKYTIDDIKKSKECTASNLNFMREQIEATRRNMMEAFDRQTNHLVQEVFGELVDNSNDCENASKRLENLVTLAEGSEDFFKSAIDNGSSTDVFRCAKSILGQCEEFEKELVQTKRRCSKVHVSVEKSKLVKLLETDKRPLLTCKVNKTTFDTYGSSCSQLNQDFQNHISSKCTEASAIDKTYQGAVSPFEDGGDGTVLATPARFDLGSASSDADIETGHDDSVGLEDHNLEKTLGSSAEMGTEIDIELSYSHYFDVETSDDEMPWFGGVVCLPDERLILSDYNKSLLIVVKDCEVITEKLCAYRPGNIALISGLLAVCLKDKNQLLLLKIQGNKLKEHLYLPGIHQMKCMKSIDENRLLVSSKGKKGTWFFEIITLDGQKCTRKELNIKLAGIYDGHVYAVQHLAKGSDTFQIIQICSASGKLQCFQLDGSSNVFQNDVEDTTSLVADKDGYLFVIRHFGEVQVLTPDGNLVTSIQRPALKKLKFAVLNDAKTKLFITSYKDSRIHVMDVKRSRVDKY